MFPCPVAQSDTTLFLWPALQSLLRFLRYRPYDSPQQFKVLIKEPIAANPETGFKRLQAILQVRILLLGCHV